MERTSEVYKTYVEILNRELVCAMEIGRAHV